MHTAPTSPTPWWHAVLKPQPWTLLLSAARWWVGYGPGITLEQRLAATGHTPKTLLKPFLDNGFHPYLMHNSYAPEDIIEMLTNPHPPTPLIEPVTHQTDLLLSRT